MCTQGGGRHPQRRSRLGIHLFGLAGIAAHAMRSYDRKERGAVIRSGHTRQAGPREAAMRLIGMPAVAGAVVLASAAPAAMATAGADPVATVSPNTVQPGQTVHLALRNCENPGRAGLQRARSSGAGPRRDLPSASRSSRPAPTGRSSAQPPSRMPSAEPRKPSTSPATRTRTRSSRPPSPSRTDRCSGVASHLLGAVRNSEQRLLSRAGRPLRNESGQCPEVLSIALRHPAIVLSGRAPKYNQTQSCALMSVVTCGEKFIGAELPAVIPAVASG